MSTGDQLPFLQSNSLYSSFLMSVYTLYCDGAARGNPGPASAGAVLKNEKGEIVDEVSEYLGETTNNQAEYQALILGLKKAIKHKVEKLEVYLDSELVVKQMNRLYKVKHPAMLSLFEEAVLLSKKIPSVKISHIRREKNSEADLLANLAIDQHFAKAES